MAKSSLYFWCINSLNCVDSLLTNTEVVVITMFIIPMKSFYSSKHITNYKLIKPSTPSTGKKGITVLILTLPIPNSRYKTTGHRVNFTLKTKDLSSMFQTLSLCQSKGNINILPNKNDCHSAFPSWNRKELGIGKCWTFQTQCLSSFFDLSLLGKVPTSAKFWLVFWF